ncbi:MAG: hypothetical protein AB2A00_11745 [Myxococcota bacterium]
MRALLLGSCLWQLPGNAGVFVMGNSVMAGLDGMAWCISRTSECIRHNAWRGACALD